jgi:hypothetical protein
MRVGAQLIAITSCKGEARIQCRLHPREWRRLGVRFAERRPAQLRVPIAPSGAVLQWQIMAGRRPTRERVDQSSLTKVVAALSKRASPGTATAPRTTVSLIRNAPRPPRPGKRHRPRFPSRHAHKPVPPALCVWPSPTWSTPRYCPPTRPKPLAPRTEVRNLTGERKKSPAPRMTAASCDVFHTLQESTEHQR